MNKAEIFLNKHLSMLSEGCTSTLKAMIEDAMEIGFKAAKETTAVYDDSDDSLYGLRTVKYQNFKQFLNSHKTK